MSTLIRTDFRRMAPVELIKPSGRVIPYGIGAATDSARGTALVNAVAAMASGDLVTFGPGNFTLTSSLTLPAGASLIGRGKPHVTGSGLTNPLVVVAQDGITVQGFLITTNTTGVGAYVGGSAIDIEDILLRDLEIDVSDSVGCGIVWSQGELTSGTASVIKGRIENVKAASPAGIGSSGFGLLATLASGSDLQIINCEMFGDTDGILVAGNSGANVLVFGGSYTSTLDAVTTGGPYLHCIGVKGRGDQQDFYGDSANLYLTDCDYREDYLGEQYVKDTFRTSPFAKRCVTIPVSDPNGDALTTGDGKNYWRVPAILNGWEITAVAAHVTTASSSGTPTFQIHNVTDTVDVLSTALTIDASEKDSSTAATAAVINSSNKTVATADELRIDVDVAGTGTKGASVEITFVKP